jgi:CO/xanthine dehydrogenase Mo-binding subunit
VDVEVDPGSGKVSVLRFTSVQDAGKAVHPAYVEGQMQGGSVQGIGWALNEEYWMGPAGAMQNSSFLDYRMPTSLDLPMIDTIWWKCPIQGIRSAYAVLGKSLCASSRHRSRIWPWVCVCATAPCLLGG